MVVITDCDTPWPDAPPKGVRVIVCAIGDSANIDHVPEWARLIRVRTQDPITSEEE